MMKEDVLFLMSHLVFDYDRDDIIAYLKRTSLFEMYGICYHDDDNFDNEDDYKKRQKCYEKYYKTNLTNNFIKLIFRTTFYLQM